MGIECLPGTIPPGTNFLEYLLPIRFGMEQFLNHQKENPNLPGNPNHQGNQGNKSKGNFG